VITDRPDKSAEGAANDRRKWGYVSGGSGGPPSLRSIEVQTPTTTPLTPYCSVEGPLSNSTNQRGQTTQRTVSCSPLSWLNLASSASPSPHPYSLQKSRVDAMLERALTQPQQCSVDPLSNALGWGIPIWSTYELQAWLDKITASLKDTHSIKRDHCVGPAKTAIVQHLKEPFIKFESYKRYASIIY
jgi:hypothetical protein